MTGIVKLLILDQGRLGVSIDLAAYEAPMKAALHDCTVYLGYVVHSTEGEPLESVKLADPIQLGENVPDPLPTDVREACQRQFRQWGIGHALTEIDQSYQRFVVAGLNAKADLIRFRDEGRLVGRHKPNDKSSSDVHNQFFQQAPPQPQARSKDAEYLTTLRNARNCIVHDAAIVSDRRTFGRNEMTVRFPGVDWLQESPDGGRWKLLPRDRPFVVQKSDVGRRVKIKHVVRTRSYRIGDRLEFSASDLAEIIFFYEILARSVGAEMHRFTDEIGRELNGR